MARAPFQVLILPFRQAADGDWQYGVLRRSDEYWQGIAGGGEDGEAPLEAAMRENGGGVWMEGCRGGAV